MPLRRYMSDQPGRSVKKERFSLNEAFVTALEQTP